MVKNKNIENKKYLSETIGALRFPLMVCVVLIHTIIPNQTQHLFVDWFDSYVIESFVRIAVPLFFFISGFLFFNGVDRFGRGEYWNKLKSRIKRLLVPYILWGVLAIFVKYVFFLFGEDDSVYLFDNYLKWIYYIVWQPFNYQLWFVRDLFLVVLISPLIYFLLKRLKIWFVLLLGGVWLFWHKNIFALI
jgi:surface polysaccharide O-acyltransferase-like enzyme